MTGGSAHNDLGSSSGDGLDCHELRKLSGGLSAQVFAAGPWSAFQALGNPA
jgi:hypothetical protein